MDQVLHIYERDDDFYNSEWKGIPGLILKTWGKIT